MDLEDTIGYVKKKAMDYPMALFLPVGPWAAFRGLPMACFSFYLFRQWKADPFLKL
jgi:hypothetical protein